MMMAIPPSLGKQGGSDAAMTLALGEVGGFHMMTTTDLGDRGKFDAMMTMAFPPSLGERVGFDAATTKALGKQGGFDTMTMPDLSNQGKFDAMTMKVVPQSLGEQGGSNAQMAKPGFNLSKAAFLPLPCADPDCDSVDSECGLWVKCALCESIMNNKATPPRPFNFIASKVGRPFTLVWLTEHNDSEMHKQRLGSLKRSGLEVLELNGTINRLERESLNQLRKKQKTIQFLPKAQPTSATKVTTHSCSHGADSMTTRMCEGIIQGYQSDSSFQKQNSCLC
jgi:hypothetical protein